MVLFNNDYSPPAAIARPEDLEMKYGVEKIVPEFADAFTHDLGGKAVVEDNDAGKSAIVMVNHSQEVKAKGMGSCCLNVPDCTETRLVPSQARSRTRAGMRDECMCSYEPRLGDLSNLVSQWRSLGLYLRLRSSDKLFLQVSVNLVCICHGSQRQP